MQTKAKELKVRDLRKEYADLVAVDSISFDVEHGECLALLGPSGCGKTTTLNMLAGFVISDGGSATVGGEEITNRAPNKRNIGMVFQSYALFPHLTALDNVAYGLKMRGVAKAERRERALGALKLTRLDHLAQRYPRQLSGGQQQRVALARALVIDPDLLLLDEPLSNLDAKLREAMRVEIKEIQRRQQVTTIFVTHDQEEAMTLADRIAVMDSGRIVQLADPTTLYSRPATVAVAQFVGKGSFVAATVTGGTEGAPTVSAPAIGWSGAALSDGTIATGNDVTLILRPEALAVSDREVGDGWAGPGIAGTVERAIFNGPHVEYWVRVGSESLLIEETSAKHQFAVGGAVFVRFETPFVIADAAPAAA